MLAKLMQSCATRLWPRRGARGSVRSVGAKDPKRSEVTNDGESGNRGSGYPALCRGAVSGRKQPLNPVRETKKEKQIALAMRFAFFVAAVVSRNGRICCACDMAEGMDSLFVTMQRPSARFFRVLIRLYRNQSKQNIRTCLLLKTSPDDLDLVHHQGLEPWTP